MRWTIYRNGEFWAEFDNSHDFLDGWHAAMDRHDAHCFTYKMEEVVTSCRVGV